MKTSSLVPASWPTSRSSLRAEAEGSLPHDERPIQGSGISTDSSAMLRMCPSCSGVQANGSRCQCRKIRVIALSTRVRGELLCGGELSLIGAAAAVQASEIGFGRGSGARADRILDARYKCRVSGRGGAQHECKRCASARDDVSRDGASHFGERVRAVRWTAVKGSLLMVLSALISQWD